MALGRNKLLTHIVFTKLTLIIVLIACAYMAVSVYERYTVEREMSDRLNGAYAEQSELEDRRDSLLDKVQYLNGEQGIESELRRHFDVAREGEQVVVIVDEEDEDAGAATFVEGRDPTATQEGGAWWQFWR